MSNQRLAICLLFAIVCVKAAPGSNDQASAEDDTIFSKNFLRYTCKENTVITVFNQKLQQSSAQLVCNYPQCALIKTCEETTTSAYCNKKNSYLTEYAVSQDFKTVYGSCCDFTPTPNNAYKETCKEVNLASAYTKWTSSQSNKNPAIVNASSGQAAINMEFLNDQAKQDFTLVKGIKWTAKGWTITMCETTCKKQVTPPKDQVLDADGSANGKALPSTRKPKVTTTTTAASVNGTATATRKRRAAAGSVHVVLNLY